MYKSIKIDNIAVDELIDILQHNISDPSLLRISNIGYININDDGIVSFDTEKRYLDDDQIDHIADVLTKCVHRDNWTFSASKELIDIGKSNNFTIILKVVSRGVTESCSNDDDSLEKAVVNLSDNNLLQTFVTIKDNSNDAEYKFMWVQFMGSFIKHS